MHAPDRSTRSALGSLGEHLHWLIAATASLIFALSYSRRQLECVSGQFASNVPATEQLRAIIVVFLVLLCIYAATLTVLAARNSASSLFLALGFLAGGGGAAVASLSLGVGVFVLFCLALWLRWMAAPGSAMTQLRRAIEYVGPLLILTVVYWIVIQTVSPLYLEHAATRSSEAYLAASSSAIRSFVAPECYSFSSFLHQYWGTIQEVPTGLTSLTLSIFGLFQIFPLWEASSFYKAFTLVTFAVYVLAGYFFYLFLRVATVDVGPALASAIVLFVGNQFYIGLIPQDMGWIGASYLGLTMSLYLLAIALRDGSTLAGIWSGVALAAQFYILAPHPEFVIYAIGIYIAVSVAYLAAPLRSGASRARAIGIYLSAAAAFTVIGLAYLEPIVWQTITRQMIVMGEKTEVPPTFVYSIKSEAFYLILLVVSGLLVLFRLGKSGEVRYPYFAFFALALVVLPLSIPGVPSAFLRFTLAFGWNVHLIPQERILAYFGIAAIVFLATAVDALLRLLRETETWRRSWFYLVHDGSRARAYLVSAVPSIIGLAVVAFIAVKGGGGDQSVVIRDASRRPVYESLGAVLANSLPPHYQQASAGYVRQRLMAFEGESAGKVSPEFVAARQKYSAALASYKVASASELSDREMRHLALQVFNAVDAAYLALNNADDIPDNIDAFLANLDDPYARVMAVTGFKYQTAFLGGGRLVTNAHNNSMMYDNRFMLGQRAIQALFIYPVDVLPHYMDWLNFGTEQGNYFISNARPPWHYETKDIFGNPFRKLLGIAGIGVYLAIDDATVRNAVADTSQDFVNLSPETRAAVSFVALRDRRAYDQAYLANVVGEYEPSSAAELERAAEVFFLHRHAFEYRQALAEYQKVLDPVVNSLMGLKERHDALLERKPGASSSAARGESGSPGRRGGTVSIDGIDGPRTGMTVNCSDASCTLVYNMAALPGWSAYVDGVRTEIWRANYAFQAVQVPRGTSYVAWVYRTPGQTLAELLSLLAFLAILAVTWGVRRGQNRGPAAG